MANTHTKRKKVFTPDLDKAICSAYLCISQDALVGTSQASFVFWNRVFENYLINTEDSSRTLNSIQSCWRDIQKFCGKWSGYLKSVEALNQSGQIDVDRVEEANRLFFQEHRKEFAFEHCWNMLKEHIKWHDVPNTTKKRSTPIIATSSTPQSPDCSQVPSTYVSLESDHTPTRGTMDSPRKRPAEKKKEAIRKSKIQDAKDQAFCNLLEQFNKNAVEKEARKAEKEARKIEKDAFKVQIEERKMKAMEEIAANERREIERKEKETDLQIMSINLSEIQDPRQKAYYNMIKNQIMDKLPGSENVEVYYPQYSNPNEDEE